MNNLNFSGLSGCFDNGIQGGDCCSPQNPCSENEGDCDADQGCLIHLKCGGNNCPNTPNFSAGADCCYDPNAGKDIKPISTWTKLLFSDSLFYRKYNFLRFMNNYFYIWM